MNRFHAACLSAFCSLMLSSAFVGRPGGPSLAGIAGARELAAAEVKALPDVGWAAVSDVQAAKALAEIPPAAPQTATRLKKDEFPLLGVRDAVVKDGKKGTFHGGISTLLGLTENNEPLPIKQKKVEERDLIRIVNVSNRNKEDMIIGHRAKDNSAATLYRTSPAGTLVKAISFKKDTGYSEIPKADARAGFEKESSFWAGRLDSSGSIASNP